MQKVKNRTHQQIRELQISYSETEIPENKLNYVCHQTFVSEKSLHGHMRKHLERNWRGVTPPIQVVAHDNSLLHFWDSMALERNDRLVKVMGVSMGSDLLLPGWLKTGRSRQKGLIAHSAPDQELPCLILEFMILRHLHMESWQKKTFHKYWKCSLVIRVN